MLTLSLSLYLSLSLSPSPLPPPPLSLSPLSHSRVRSDKSQIYKWGCSRSTCNEEDRPRKRKVCCTNWFCNGDVPIDWLEGETMPTLTIPSETTPTSNYSQPPTPNITTHTTPPVEESPNCTVAEGNPLHLSPCVGPGSVPDLVPIKTEPVPTSSGNLSHFAPHYNTLFFPSLH